VIQPLDFSVCLWVTWSVIYPMATSDYLEFVGCKFCIYNDFGRPSINPDTQGLEIVSSEPLKRLQTRDIIDQETRSRVRRDFGETRRYQEDNRARELPEEAPTSK
jgi:hypothetical protein